MKLQQFDYVQIKKLGSLTPTGVRALSKIYIGYCIKGYVFSPLCTGESFRVIRTECNGVTKDGIFITSIVKSIKEQEKDEILVHTMNSTYEIKRLATREEKIKCQTQPLS